MQYLVPKGTIFASSLTDRKGYSLLDVCATAFDFNHFELFTQDELYSMYPQHEAIIKQYALLNIDQ